MEAMETMQFINGHQQLAVQEAIFEPIGTQEGFRDEMVDSTYFKLLSIRNIIWLVVWNIIYFPIHWE